MSTPQYGSLEKRNEQQVTIAAAVERVGYGPAQILAGVLGGGTFLVGGCALMMMGSISTAIGKEMHLEPLQMASLMSIVFIGMLLGNSTSGPLGDAYGRRCVIIACYVCVLVSTLGLVFAGNFEMLAFWRLLLGISFGLGVPPWMVLSTEITPSRWRMIGNAFAQSLFALGEMYAAAIVLATDPSMRHIDWRLLTWACIPPVVLLLLWTWMSLVESPAYLAARGKLVEASEVIETMARQNRATPVSAALRLDDADSNHFACPEAVYEALVGVRMRFSTIAVVYNCFVLNLIYYGVLYGLPRVVEDVEKEASPALSLLLGAFWELPGLLAGALLGTWFNRLPVIAACYAGMAVAMAGFSVGISSGDTWFADHVLQHSIVAIKMLSSIAFVVVYQYTSEIYPAIARTTGSGICVSGGRVGAILAPLWFEALDKSTGSFSAFFLLSSFLAGVSFVVSMFLPFETACLDEQDTDA